MNRKITSLGLALFAALALGAVTASTAAAQTSIDHFTTSAPWTPTVSAAGPQVFESTTGEGKGYSCSEVSATVTANLNETDDEATVIPKYGQCVAFEEEEEVATVFVDTNDCDYNFTGATTEGNPTNGNHANVEIKNHVDSKKECHIDIDATIFKFPCASVPNQIVKHAVRYEQVKPEGAKEHILVKATAHGIKSTTTPSIACPTPTGETETHDNGSYTGDVTVKAHDRNENAIDLTLNQEATEV